MRHLGRYKYNRRKLQNSKNRLPESFRGAFGWVAIFYGRVMREFIGIWRYNRRGIILYGREFGRRGEKHVSRFCG